MQTNNNIKYENTCDAPLALCSTSNKDKFWFDNPKELYENEGYLSIIPKYEMTRNQQSNAISRLCIYAIILILLFNRGQSLLFIPVTILLLTILFNKVHLFDKLGHTKELNKILDIREMAKRKVEETPDVNPTYETYQDRIDNENAQKLYTVKSGVYDSNGELHLDYQQNPAKYCNGCNKNDYTADEMRDYRKNTCRKPTIDNPLMNTPVTDFGSINQPSACNEDDENIKDNIKVNFNHELFRDVDEVFERSNSQRQFYTLPNTAIPNMQTEVAEWLYKQPDTIMCKENGDLSKCSVFYDDVRYRIR